MTVQFSGGNPRYNRFVIDVAQQSHGDVADQGTEKRKEGKDATDTFAAFNADGLFSARGGQGMEINYGRILQLQERQQSLEYQRSTLGSRFSDLMHKLGFRRPESNEAELVKTDMAALGVSQENIGFSIRSINDEIARLQNRRSRTFVVNYLA